MAYTSAPETQTYSVERLPAVYDLDVPPGSTSSSLSFGMKNIVPLKENDELWGETRYALSGVNVASSGTCRGMYVWEKTIGTVYYFVVVDNAGSSKVYTSTTGLAASWTAVTTLSTSATTPVRFTEFIDATNVKKLVLVDGIEGYVFTTNAAGTKITDVDFPTPHIPFPVFIDGYLFLAKAATGDIYNSDLNDPAIWTAGSFISSELYPDDIQALVKINNYLLAIGTHGCEYFYDAANPTASPLARMEGNSLAFGTPFPNTIANSKDVTVFLANNNDGEVVLKLIEGLKSTDIPCPVISLLNISLAAGTTTADKLRGYFSRQNGHLCYSFTFNGVTNVNTPSTYVFSFSSKMWTEFIWGGFNGNYPVYFTFPTTSSNLLTYVAGHDTGVHFGTLSPSTATDNLDGGVGINIRQEIRTKINDFGTLNLKTMSRFGIVYTSTNYTINDIITIWWDDGGRYSDMVGNRQLPKFYAFPFITQLGSFRQRCFKITTDTAYPIRYRAIEVDINKGQQ